MLLTPIDEIFYMPFVCRNNAQFNMYIKAKHFKHYKINN